VIAGKINAFSSRQMNATFMSVRIVRGIKKQKLQRKIIIQRFREMDIRRGGYYGTW
jgi:hypothetical protein